MHTMNTKYILNDGGAAIIYVHDQCLYVRLLRPGSEFHLEFFL